MCNVAHIEGPNIGPRREIMKLSKSDKRVVGAIIGGLVGGAAGTTAGVLTTPLSQMIDANSAWAYPILSGVSGAAGAAAGTLDIGDKAKSIALGGAIGVVTGALMIPLSGALMAARPILNPISNGILGAALGGYLGYLIADKE
jgi:hypothetical protein